MRILLSLSALLVLTGCPALRELHPETTYIKADRQTHDIVAPIIEALADEDPSNDPDLSGANGALLLEKMKLWDARVSRAEQEVTK